MNNVDESKSFAYGPSETSFLGEPVLRRAITALAASAVVLGGLTFASVPASALETISTNPAVYDPAQDLEITINGFPTMATGNGYIYWLQFQGMTGGAGNTGASTGTLGSQTDCTAQTGVSFTKVSGAGTALPNGQDVVGNTNACEWISPTIFKFSYKGATGLDSTSVVKLTFPSTGAKVIGFTAPVSSQYGVNFTAGSTISTYQLSYVCWGNCPVDSDGSPVSAPPQVTLNIDPNEGECKTTAVTGLQGSWTTAPDAYNCGKPGALFVGYNTERNGSGIPIAPGGNLNLTFDNTLYAIYETPRTAGAPTDVVAVAGRNQITVSWKAPADLGSGEISNYLAQATPSGRVCIASSGSADPLSCTFNLPATNTQYSFKVQALNIAGWGAESGASNAVSPYDVVVLTAERQKAGFFQRLAGWGSTISMNGRAPGLAPGTAVTPQWKAGDGEWVSESRDGVKIGSDNQISWSKKIKRNLNRDPISVRFAVGDVTSEEYALRIGSAVGVPAAPRDVKTSFIEARVPAQRRLQVSWQAPANDGGSPITSYEVSAQLLDNSAPVRCRVNADQPLTCILPIGALDRQKTYTVKVTAINARGKSQPAKANFRRPA